MDIKRVVSSDIHQLVKIGRQTFYETFAAGNTEADMEKYLDENFSVNKLNAELSNINSEFYFALLNDNIVGYLKLNLGDAQTELKDNSTLEIERLYVLKEYQGINFGQLLFDKALQIAKQHHVDYVWLGVWELNIRAINFYKKNGFVEFDQHIFKVGDDEQTDIMMRLKLND